MTPGGPVPVWDNTDGKEFGRLVREMQTDATLQFQIFTFALSATAVILGVLAPNPAKVGDNLPASAFFFLIPLIVLIPSSLMILNRARTRNRKSAYMICYLDAKRLRIGGVTDTASLADVRRRPDLPWETALHILMRTGKTGLPHLPPALKYMGYCYLLAELVCLSPGAYFAISLKSPPSEIFMGAGAAFWLSVAIYRTWALRQLKARASIQYFAKLWLVGRFGDTLVGCPQYFRDWIDETWHEKQPEQMRF
jgi:hypothetical protein